MEGIDVHGDKGVVDWSAVARSGVKFAFVKATEGRSFIDRRIAYNLREATKAGVLVGPYHYARPDLTGGLERAAAEAEFFCSIVTEAGWKKGVHAAPVLDIEVGGGDLTAWAEHWCRYVEAKLKVKPIVYSYTYFIRSHLRGKALARYPLWLANYGPNDGSRHSIPQGEGPWVMWSIHQYTSNGRTPGVMGRCDRNFAPSLASIRSVPAEPPRTDKEAMWKWIRWYRGHGEFKKVGPRHAASRPNVPLRIPRRWWSRLLLNIFGFSVEGGR